MEHDNLLKYTRRLVRSAYEAGKPVSVAVIEPLFNMQTLDAIAQPSALLPASLEKSLGSINHRHTDDILVFQGNRAYALLGCDNMYARERLEEVQQSLAENKIASTGYVVEFAPPQEPIPRMGPTEHMPMEVVYFVHARELIDGLNNRFGRQRELMLGSLTRLRDLPQRPESRVRDPVA